MTTPTVTTEMLHAFVDGHLSDADRARVEAHLATHPEQAAEVADWIAQNDALRSLFPAPDQAIPLPEIPEAANNPRAPWRMVAASVAMLGIGVALGWAGRGQVPVDPAPLDVAGLVQEAMVAHAVYSADPHRPVEVAASEEALLIRWLSNRVGEQLSAPDLRANGFDLVGGRLLAVAEGPAAQFMYQNADGVRITLFAVRSDNSMMAEFQFRQNGSTNSFYWQDDHLRYAIIGDLPRNDLAEIATRVYNTLI